VRRVQQIVEPGRTQRLHLGDAGAGHVGDEDGSGVERARRLDEGLPDLGRRRRRRVAAEAFDAEIDVAVEIVRPEGDEAAPRRGPAVVEAGDLARALAALARVLGAGRLGRLGHEPVGVALGQLRGPCRLVDHQVHHHVQAEGAGLGHEIGDHLVVAALVVAAEEGVEPRVVLGGE
jgi:hypothetical protein